MRGIGGLCIVGAMFGLAASAHAEGFTGMSEQCVKMVGDYIDASDNGNGERALAMQKAIRKAGGCGVLAAEASAGGDSRFPKRGATPLTDANVGACHQSPAECAQQVERLAQGTSAEAKSRLMMDAINQGIALGQAMASAIAAAAPPSGGGYSQRGAFTDCRAMYMAAGNAQGAAKCGLRETNMNSLAAPPIKNGVGQGSGAYRGPTPSSDITGTK